MDNMTALVPKSATHKTVALTDRFKQLVERRGHRSMMTSRSVTPDEARFLARKLRNVIGAAADDAVLLRVLEHNPEIIRLAERYDGGEPAFIAYLPLNEAGFAALVSGQLARRDPPVAFLCRHGETPVAIYMWCVYTPGSFVPALAAIAPHFANVAPLGAPLFCSAANVSSERLFPSLGFVAATRHYPDIEPDVLVVLPADGRVPRPQPVGLSPQKRTRVARTLEDAMKVFAVRAATYIADQACPFDEEFDGNDFCAAHILGEIDGEPAGCIRIRFFADFVKLERLAVRAEFRMSRLAFRLVRAAIDYARAKGFRTMYGHARHDLVDFWSRFGFRVMEGRLRFTFSGIEYVEMRGEITPAERPVDLRRTPYELIRPEGAWDTPGPLDRSAARRTGPDIQRAA